MRLSLNTHPQLTDQRFWQPVPWQEAPDWAHWAAMDRTGNWFWYEEEPKDEDGYFRAVTGKIAQFTHFPYPYHWRLSRQHRPTDACIITPAPSGWRFRHAASSKWQ